MDLMELDKLNWTAQKLAVIDTCELITNAYNKPPNASCYM